MTCRRCDPPLKEGWKIVARFTDGSPFILDECGRVVDTGCGLVNDKPNPRHRPQSFHGFIFWDEGGR